MVSAERSSCKFAFLPEILETRVTVINLLETTREALYHSKHNLGA